MQVTERKGGREHTCNAIDTDTSGRESMTEWVGQVLVMAEDVYADRSLVELQSGRDEGGPYVLGNGVRVLRYLRRNRAAPDVPHH